MEKKIKVKRIEDVSVWDEFVYKSIHGTVFSTSQWIKEGASAQGGNPVIFGVWEEQKLIAGVSFAEIISGPLKKATTPVLTPYGGFIYNSDPTKPHSDNESLQLLCAEKLIGVLRKKYNHVFLVHSPGFYDIRPFSWQNWQESVRYTYLLDLSDTDKLMNNIRERVKRKIRTAERSIIFGGSINAEQIGEMYAKIFRDRERIPPVPPRMVTAMVGGLIKTGLLEINTAQEANGETVALQVLVIGKDTVYTWVYGTIPDKNYTGADSLLIWDAIKRYHKTHKMLDLVGANIPSIAFFKKGFGGVLTPYYVTESYSSLTSRTAFQAYSKLRKIYTKGL